MVRVRNLKQELQDCSESSPKTRTATDSINPTHDNNPEMEVSHFSWHTRDWDNLPSPNARHQDMTVKEAAHVLRRTGKKKPKKHLPDTTIKT